MKCSKHLISILFLWVIAIPTPGPSATGKETSLTELIAEALTTNNELIALREVARAARREAPAAGTLPDPVLGFGLANVPLDSFALDQEAMTQKQVFISQTFPWFGSLELREQMAMVTTMMADIQVREKELAIAARLAELWFGLGYLVESRRINDNQRTIVEQNLRIAETRYGTGAGLQQDVLSGQVKLSEFIEEQVAIAADIEATQALIGELLQGAAGVTVVWPAAGIPDGQSYLPHPPHDEIEANPSFKLRVIATEKARLQVALAEKDYYPDVSLRVSYGQREDNPTTGEDRADFLSINLAMPIPLWQKNRQDNRLAGARSRLAAAEADLMNMRQSLRQRRERLTAELAGAEKNFALYDQVLRVQASHLADSALAAYSVGKVEFRTMLDARLGVLKVERKAAGYLYEIYKKQAAIAILRGQFPEPRKEQQ